MDDKERRMELAKFLRTRRARLSPAQFHLPAGVGQRRTPGLRREELAQLAGVGLTWYTKLEQGQAIQVSAQILESLARTLQLNADERAHLFVLARTHLPLPSANPVEQHISADLQRVLDSFNPYPAFVVNQHWDISGRNLACARVFSYSTTPHRHQAHNLLWLMFTDPALRQLFVEWEPIARRALALFRASEGRDADSAWFSELRDRLLQASPEFSAWWQLYDVCESHIERKELNHPCVGQLILQSTTMLLTNAPELRLFLYTPLPEADTAHKLAFLLEQPAISNA
ncbi:helix-turn-helix transcriptional regulator [Ktedonosporobacter rubrisoli]|nr:helix-turn-helix transcriptional regulator [Ktedonosporobacter rubrisoli]